MFSNVDFITDVPKVPFNDDGCAVYDLCSEKGAPRKDNTSKDLLGVGNLSFFTNFVSFNKYLGLPMDG